MARNTLTGVTDLATLTAQDIDAIGNAKGQEFARPIKTNQVRNFFSAVTAIRTDYKLNKEYNEQIERDLVLIKPKLAYAAGRQRAVRPLHELVAHAVNAVVDSKNKPKALENFLTLVETIVAYHKYYGGN